MCLDFMYVLGCILSRKKKEQKSIKEKKVRLKSNLCNNNTNNNNNPVSHRAVYLRCGIVLDRSAVIFRVLCLYDMRKSYKLDGKSFRDKFLFMKLFTGRTLPR